MIKYIKKNKLTFALLVVIYILSVGLTVMLTSINQRNKYDAKIEDLRTAYEEEMSTLRDELENDYYTRVVELEKYYEYGSDVTLVEQEAEYIAKVLYGTARNHAESDKRAVIWCILNRVDHHSHPDTIMEVCEQPRQWVGYSSDNPVLDELYELALTELKSWHNDGHRPISNEYIYMSWSSKEILLRDTFEESKSTHYWRMK